MRSTATIALSALAGLLVLPSAGSAVARTADGIILDVTSRDHSRMGYVAPVAGSKVVSYLEIENLGDQAIPKGTSIQCTYRGPGLNKKGTLTLKKAIKANRRKWVAVRGPVLKVRPGTRVTVRCTFNANKKGRERAQALANNSHKSVFFVGGGLGKKSFEVVLNPEGEGVIKRQGHGNDRLHIHFTRPRGPKILDHPIHDKALMRPLVSIEGCSVPLYPWTRIGHLGDMREPPHAPLPAPEGKGQLGVWMQFVWTLQRPKMQHLPAKMFMFCRIHVGVHLKGPRMTGSRSPATAWVPNILWWKGKIKITFNNPWSIHKKPPKPKPAARNLSVLNASASASNQRQEPLEARRNVWARPRVKSEGIKGQVPVVCDALAGNKVKATAKTTWSAKGGQSKQLALKLGQLAAGRYTLRCRVKPTKSMKDKDGSDNRRETSITVKE